MTKLTSDDITELYEAHAQSILRFLMRRTLDAQVSIDLVAETYAVAFEQRNKFRGDRDRAAHSWLFGIADNLLHDYFRRGSTEQRAVQRLGVDPVEVLEHEIERIDELAGISELRSTVADALSDLGEESRIALQLRVVEELSYPDVAGRMNVSEQVARARVSRGLRKLRARLEELEIEGVPESV
ncbi:MAG: RNA polymerase sigma factor [Solirubrobacterales bacterium]